MTEGDRTDLGPTPAGPGPDQTARDATGPVHQWPPASVSVVIPVRNGAEVLHRQLDALAAQTFTGSWEVVVADTGSTDGSAEVAMRWSDRLPGLRVIDASARRGVGAARNRGCEESTADAVLFCDADDEASPGWVAAMVSALGGHPIVGGPCQIRDPDGTTVPAAEKLGLTLGLVPFPVGACFGVWRDVFLQVGGFETDHPEAQAEDAEFCLRAWELGHVAGFAPGALMTKSRRPDLRSTYRQWKGYGTGAMFNALRFRDRGTIGVLVRREARLIGWMLVHLPEVRRREGRMRWVRWAAAKVGWMTGCLRYRRLPVAPRPPGARALVSPPA
ncbi:MAG: glycosyltransferase [Acidimicrobiales bacterium]